MRARLWPALAAGIAALGVCGTSSSCAAVQGTKLFLAGDSRQLRVRTSADAQRSDKGTPLLVVALDGVDRDLFYEMLRAGELPHFAELLGGGAAGRLEHAHLDETLLATMPSTTMAAWATVFTGEPPSVHGITGNEFFIRDKRSFGAPAPVTFSDAAPTLACFTKDEYANALLGATPTVYEKMRKRDPDVLVWVAMQYFYAGADLLLTTERTALAKAFEGALASKVEKVAKGEEGRAVYASLDRQVIEVVTEQLGDEGSATPDVLTVYLSGTDLYGHIALEGPDESRRAYLREILDPEIARLVTALRARDALAGRWVIVTSDHGHTAVVKDEAHSLATDPEDDPPAVLKAAGFRLRPHQLEVDEDADFQAVLAYQGATAYVYLADRSKCEKPKDRCDWTAPPRFDEDVMAVAGAYARASADGTGAPGMKGTLDLVLARRAKPHAEDDAPFEVYEDGALVPVGEYLSRHPHPTYVALEQRLRDLAVGPRGERAGDVLLIAHNGDRARPEDRYYFAAPYRSWHGSPSKKDSEVPLVIAHAGKTATAIADAVRTILGPTPRQQKVADLMLGLRYGSSRAK